jgi:hypothetical protein
MQPDEIAEPEPIEEEYQPPEQEEEPYVEEAEETEEQPAEQPPPEDEPPQPSEPESPPPESLEPVVFEADKNQISANECFTLYWYGEDAQDVTFGGITDDEAPFEGEFRKCDLCKSETYSLRVTHLDGSQERMIQDINVVSGSCDSGSTSNGGDGGSDQGSGDQSSSGGSGASDSCPTCGDGTCQSDESNNYCENESSCPQDCGGGESGAGASNCSSDLDTYDACTASGGQWKSGIAGFFCLCPP